MSQTLILCFRAFQALAAAAGIGLAAYGKLTSINLLLRILLAHSWLLAVVNWHLRGPHLSTPPSISFFLFSSIFSVFSILYLVFAPRFAPKATHPKISLSVEAINCIFYFAGFIAVAVCLGDLAFCTGSVCMAGRGTAVLAAAQFSL